MTTIFRRVMVVGIASLVAVPSVSAADSDLEELKRQIRILQRRVEELEKERAAPRAPAAPPAPPAVVAVPETKKEEVAAGHASQVEPRGAMRDEQQAAPRPNDLTLDPKFRGFIPVPHTPVLIKFNAKPRVDFTYDTKNAGDDNRFITAKIPVDNAFDEGGGPVFNANAKGSQLRIDVRAPSIDGNPRFYYENDFYGSGGGEFPYRVRHLYGQFYNFVVGQTFSVFEDPDAWPDTVDYEGPNSAIFARRPLVRYQHAFNDEWQANFGIEQPESEIDFNGEPDARAVNHVPDGGFNVRWENEKRGHVQFGSILRGIGANDTTRGDQTVFGWGTNLATNLKTIGRDSAQVQLTYGEGLFRYDNDDFFNNDAAFDRNGDLEAIPMFGGMLGYTHHWAEQWRSTASYGYVHLDNAASQAGDAYHLTHYGSANVIWQFRKRLALGVEGLYGFRETKDGAHGDVFRVNMGLMYSIFD